MLKRTPLKRKKPSKEQIEDSQKQHEKDREFYWMLWKKRRPYSELSDEFLGNEVNKACIHHIVPKSKWKEGRYVEENCILLTIQEHANVENNMYKYSEINRRRIYLKEKYDL